MREASRWAEVMQNNGRRKKKGHGREVERRVRWWRSRKRRRRIRSGK